MDRYIILTLLAFNFLLAGEADHIIFQKITILPDEAESIAIYNPTQGPIDLSDYYISDAEYSVLNKHYYNLPSGSDFWSGFSSDFIVRFPNGTIINSGETLTIGLYNQSTFQGYYGIQADLTIQDDMLDAVDGDDTIGASIGLLGDSYEVLILFKWDGDSNSLVQDVDYFYWGNTQGLSLYGVDKTGVLTYNPDTPFNIQEQNILDAHVDGETYIRKSSNEIGELGLEDNIVGNGITGDDETSEVFIDSWEIISEAGCTLPNDPNYDVGAIIDDGSCLISSVTHTIEDIVTGPIDGHVVYNATISGLIVDFGDYREPNNGPQVLAIQDDNGYQLDMVVWDWDVSLSSIGYMVNPNNQTEYVVIASGLVDVYNGSFQFELASETDIVEYKSYNLEGVFIPELEDDSIIKAEINPAPYVIIPTLGERLDYSFSFPSNSRVVVRIFDFNGNLITSLVDKYYESGGTIERKEDRSDWDGKNKFSQIVAPGTYFMHIEAINLLTGDMTTDMAPVVIGVYK